MRRAAFRKRLQRGDPLLGTFQKLPSHRSVELLGLSGIDFAVLDNEHAPFDPGRIDACCMASHLTDLPLLVRIPRNEPDVVLCVLDMGAAGILVPHVKSASEARRAVSAARYGGGSRGFSPSTRAGGYGTRGFRTYMDAADDEAAIVLQIEDAAALDCLDEIASVEGVTGLFVGRADLAVSLNVEWSDPRLDRAVEQAARAARSSGIAGGVYLADLARLEDFRRMAASFFIVGSDQDFIKAKAGMLAQAFREESGGAGNVQSVPPA